MRKQTKERKWIRQRFKARGSMKLSSPDESGLQDGVATNGRYGPSKETNAAGKNTALDRAQDSGTEEIMWKGKEGTKPARQVENQPALRRSGQEPGESANPNKRSDGETLAPAEMVRCDASSLRIGGQCEESRRRRGERKRRRRDAAERTGSGCLGPHSISEQLSQCTRGS